MSDMMLQWTIWWRYVSETSQTVYKDSRSFIQWPIVPSEIICSRITISLISVTSSTHFPRSNGHAERSVHAKCKEYFEEFRGPLIASYCMAMLIINKPPYHAWCKLSPAELLMGRKRYTKLPQLKPKWLDVLRYDRARGVWTSPDSSSINLSKMIYSHMGYYNEKGDKPNNG